METDELPSFFRKVLAYRRKSRVSFMLSKVITAPGMKVIDIGCGNDGRSFDDYIPADWEITGVDLFAPELVQHQHPNFRYLQQDAQDLSRFKDNEFDLAISIGMMEHITDDQMFERISSEFRRVAKQYIVNVPYRYCWVEPHYGVPFFPLLPYSVKLALIKALNLSNHRKGVTEDPDVVRRDYMWLSNAEYRRRFPDAKIYLLPTLETIAIVKKRPL